jgi:hypothetical protein
MAANSSTTFTMVVLFIEGGRAVTLIVNPADTVLAVKTQLQVLSGVPASATRLVFQGGEVFDHETLRELEVLPGMGMSAVSQGARLCVFREDMSTHIDVPSSDTLADIRARIVMTYRANRAAGITFLWRPN